MPLMSEGKAGPSKSKLRAIWRKLARCNATDALRMQELRRCGRNVSLSMSFAIEGFETTRKWLTGEAVPVGLPTKPWQEVCAELSSKLPAIYERIGA
jgi:hypothetical protein